MFYSSQGQPANYDKMSTVLSVNVFLTVMGEGTEVVSGHMPQHLHELMEDTKTYGWTSVRDYHLAWLQHLEQWRATWVDKSNKMKLMRVFM